MARLRRVFLDIFRKLFLLLIIHCVINATAQPPIKRFEYKYSFKPPYLAQRDGSIPFWEYGGNAIASSENVRLAPSLKSQKGAVWTKAPISFQWWEVDIMFRVTGRGRIGADGLAFWYTQNKGSYDGDVFGSSDQWNGLGVIMDSFDNDNKHNNPYVMAVINDGTKKFDHQNDGSTQLLSGCLRDFRNKPYPTRLKVEYYQDTLTVLFHNGMTNNEADYEMCFRAEGVRLPAGGHFGVSAATGGLADDHDVVHFLSSSLHVPGGQGQGQTQAPISAEEQQKLSQEYQDYQRKLEQQKEDYRREHPDETKDKESEFEDWFENDSQRELRQIFQGQSSILDVSRELHKKVDEILGKQVNSLSILSSVYQMQQMQPGAPAQPGQQAVPQIAGLPLQRHEVESILQTQGVVLNTLTELRTYLAEITRKTDAISQAQARAPTAQVQAVGYESQAALNDLRDSVNSVKQNIAAIGQRMGAQSQTSCPDVNCLSAGLLGLFLAGHLVVMFLYSLYKDRKESQAKKFY